MSRICPICHKADIVEVRIGYRCANCGFTIPRAIRERVLPKITIDQLFKYGKTDYVDGFHRIGFNGTFSAKLSISKNMKVTIVPQFRTEGKCPKCGNYVLISPEGLWCINDKLCHFFIPRIYAGKKLNDTHLLQLIKNGVTKNITGFYRKKDGKKFNANLSVAKDFSIVMIFDNTSI